MRTMSDPAEGWQLADLLTACVAVVIVAFVLLVVFGPVLYDLWTGRRRADRPVDRPDDTLTSLIDAAGVTPQPMRLRPAVPRGLTAEQAEAFAQIEAGYGRTAPEVTYQRTEQQP